MMATLEPLVTIIIVTYNSADTINTALEAIQLQTLSPDLYTVVIVDNNSSDNTISIIQSNNIPVQLIELSNNIGFGSANNMVLDKTKTPFVALINPDCVIAPDWLQQMLDFMQQNNNIAIAGTKLYYRHSQVIQHAGGEIMQNGLTYHVGENELDTGQYDSPVDHFYVTGAAIFCYYSDLFSVKFFDEIFFLYYEEVDLCWRLRISGKRIMLCPDARAIHLEDKSLGHSQSPRYLLHYHRSRIQFILKHSNRRIFFLYFLPNEWDWLSKKVRGQHRLIVILVYCIFSYRIIPLLLDNSIKQWWGNYDSNHIL